MIVLVSGGCKNGKSSFAEKLICKMAKDNKKYYIATMIVNDDEDKKRVENHIKNRANLNFNTIEVKKSLNELKKLDEKSFILFDSLTAFVLNHMTYNDNKIDEKSADEVDENKIISDVIKELNDINIKNKNIVFVTDYIFSDAYNNASEYSLKYLKCLASVCKYIANVADIVIDIKYTNEIIYKGSSVYEKIF